VARFAAEGASVVLTDRDRETAEAAAKEISEETSSSVYPFIGDVSVKADDEATIQFAHEKMGGIDVLVNNAGVYYEEPIEEISEERWDETINVDLKGTFLMCQAVVPHFKEKRSGVIINMASTNGIAGEINYTHYNAAKGGVVLITKTLAIELGPFNNRPGYGPVRVRTGLHR
jgi:3-oxoacyl-[acyl-carrier protein] reductase